jgi:hypothetical protein
MVWGFHLIMFDQDNGRLDPLSAPTPFPWKKGRLSPKFFFSGRSGESNPGAKHQQQEE